jgi:hypothetical protein
VGIPQGSILGPLLFLLYINDLPECLHEAAPRLFADDTNLTVAGESIEEVELAMNNDLLSVHTWLLANKLSLNVSKTEFILIGSNHRLKNLTNQPNIKIDQDKIKFIIVDYLGFKLMKNCLGTSMLKAWPRRLLLV